MTPEAMRVAIAEAVGINVNAINEAWSQRERDELRGIKRWSDSPLPTIPNYPESLDAMHEVEKMLTEKQKFEYFTHLGGGLNDSGWLADWDIIAATAAQRREAFGLALGLWKEGE